MEKDVGEEVGVVENAPCAFGEEVDDGGIHGGGFLVGFLKAGSVEGHQGREMGGG
jgi:hypothetical protein